MYPPTTLPAQAPVEGFLELLGDVELDPHKLGSVLPKVLSRLRPKLAYRVSGILQSRDAVPDQYGMTITVTAFLFGGSRAMTVWGRDWDEVIGKASIWIVNTLLPVTRAGRLPGATGGAESSGRSCTRPTRRRPNSVALDGITRRWNSISRPYSWIRRIPIRELNWPRCRRRWGCTSTRSTPPSGLSPSTGRPRAPTRSVCGRAAGALTGAGSGTSGTLAGTARSSVSATGTRSSSGTAEVTAEQWYRREGAQSSRIHEELIPILVERYWPTAVGLDGTRVDGKAPEETKRALRRILQKEEEERCPRPLPRGGGAEHPAGVPEGLPPGDESPCLR